LGPVSLWVRHLINREVHVTVIRPQTVELSRGQAGSSIYDSSIMGTLYTRPYRYQIRIVNKLLPKPLWATFDMQRGC
jgi:hypothetical protein